MRSLRWMLVIALIFIPGLLFAQQTPVVVGSPLCADAAKLQSLDFRLHARCGETLIGTMPLGGEEVPEGITPLASGVLDFSDVCQVDRRALQSLPDLESTLNVVFEGDGWSLIQANAEILNALSSAGVPFRAIPIRPLTARKSGRIIDETDTFDPFVGVILDRVSTPAYQGYIQVLQNFVTRNTYNPECDSAALWIKQQFVSFGLTAELDTFQIGNYNKYNVIAELPGSQNPDQIYYMAAHYDATAGLPIFPEPSAPGADDDGSGAALVLECARVMSQFSFHKTVRFAVFAGNEQGLIGSEAYVAGLPQTGETYLGVFDADMIGWSGSDPWPPDLVIYTNDDPSSLLLAGKISEAVSAFVPGFLEPIIHQDPTMVYSDHAPFWDAGIPATLAMEDEPWGSDLNPHYHSVNDLLQYLDLPYARHCLDAILASASDLAIPDGSQDPYLTADGVTINDFQGNNNGQIEYGESILLTIPVINAGGASAPSVNVTLSESDPYIAFTDWQESYGAIPSLDTVSVTDAFAADVVVNVPDEHIFNVTVTMTSGTNVWTSVVQTIAHAPDISIAQLLIDDTAGGNGDGQLDPGETADLQITLANQGSYQAQNLMASLSCTSPYIIINTPSMSYGTLQPGQSVERNFSVTALSAAPAFFAADFTLNYQAAGGWTASNAFALYVGDINYLPTGPDAYGYSAYDVNDAPYAPVFDWIEIDPGQGGPGTLLEFTADDQTLYVNLPFTFVYYGQDYTELSVCSNGWIACGHVNNTDYLNSGIPSAAGPPAMIAPFWDDLSPQAEGSVSYYYNSAEDKFIVEYYQVRDFQPNNHHLTFQVVLYDPTEYPTTTGDGKILFQYGQLDNTSSCTVGIEDHTEQVGIQYLYNTIYDSTATPIGLGRAILFTTGEAVPDVQVTLTPYGMPIQIPPGGGSFNFNIAVANNETTPQSFDVWCDATLPNGNHYGPVLGPAPLNMPGGLSANRDRIQAVPGGAPTGNYSYNAYVGIYPTIVWSSDSFAFSKQGAVGNAWAEGWDNWGETLDFDQPAGTQTAILPMEYKLGQNYPNPFNAETVIPLELPQRSQVKIELFNVCGQRLGILYEGIENAGWRKIRFGAGDLSSGVYFYRITAEGLEHGGKFTDAGKMLVLK